MAIRQGNNGHRVIDTIYQGHVEYISSEAATIFYDLVKQHQNSSDFVINRSEPQKLVDGACHIKYQYDVNLFGRHLCTIYRSDRDDGTPNFYDIEINDRIYSARDLSDTIGIEDPTFIGNMVKERWEADQKKREDAFRKKINEENLAFVKSFLTRTK